MLFFRLILTSLRRHRARTALGLAGIMFSAAGMLTVVTVLQGAIGMFERILATDSEFVVFERAVSDLFFSNVPVGAVETMETWSCVRRARPVLVGVVSSPDHPIITCFGVAESDPRLRDAAWLEGDRAGFGRDPRGVVLGERAADFLKARLGMEVPIGRERFQVAGVVRTSNGFEDGGVFLPLVAAQKFFHKEGMASVVTVKLRQKEDAAEFRRKAAAAFPGLVALENAEFGRSYSQFKLLKATGWAAGGCGLLLGSLGVANTMIMSVFGRIRELAILRIIGFSGRQIAGLVFGESALVSAVGALAGVGLGAVAVGLLGRLPALHGYVEGHVGPAAAASIVVLAGLTGVAGACYPAWYALRIRPVEALRFE